MAFVNNYYNSQRMKKAIEAGNQRGLVGGMWDEIGRLQFDYVVKQGLARDMKFLDVGCGCLRGGVHFIDYLDVNCYFGIDLSQDLMDAGYDTELSQAGLQHKLARNNLHCTDVFDATCFGVRFDMILALSVFTHLTLNHIKLCLDRLAAVTQPGSQFYATIFHCPDDTDWTQALSHSPGEIITFPDRDPYHYRYADLEFCCRDLPWKLQNLESWQHPRDQLMAHFLRLDEAV
jgi:cyclopropane fatty-acyl-phospholipid synthase-like methyltransferase